MLEPISLFVAVDEGHISIPPKNLIRLWRKSRCCQENLQKSEVSSHFQIGNSVGHISIPPKNLIHLWRKSRCCQENLQKSEVSSHFQIFRMHQRVNAAHSDLLQKSFETTICVSCCKHFAEKILQMFVDMKSRLIDSLFHIDFLDILKPR